MSLLFFIIIIAILVCRLAGRINTSTGRIHTRVRKSSPENIGETGELIVNDELSSLPPDRYIVLNDLMFRNGSYTTQIDHIVVSVYGIFIIETKTYKGLIYGNSNQDYWTQNIHGNKYSLYNPLFQNKSHISFLLNKFNNLRSKESCMIPVVVFLGTYGLRIYGKNDNILRIYELLPYIRSFSHELITIAECHEIASLLQSNNITDYSEREAHLFNVQSAISRHEDKIRQGICPQCGGRLILRNGKYRDFYGCSNFPRCRYTR